MNSLGAPDLLLLSEVVKLKLILVLSHSVYNQDFWGGRGGLYFSLIGGLHAGLCLLRRIIQV